MTKKKLHHSGPNISAIGGIVAGIVLLVAAVSATASEPLSFLNLPSAILVIGGTLAATLITYSLADVGRALARFGALLQRETVVDRGDAERFVKIAGLWKGGKLTAVEKELEVVKSPFVRTGLRLLVDGMPGDAIGTVLEWRMRQQEALERREADVFRTMATYAPAFGMAGTIIGLVNMLRLMGAGATPQQIGTNLAFALITTLYGLVLANALLKPMAAKIEIKAYDHLRVLSAVAEAFREIGEGHGPSHVREILLAIGEHHENEMNNADALALPAEEKSHVDVTPTR
jgi:chemotaxis protein MotA